MATTSRPADLDVVRALSDQLLRLQRRRTQVPDGSQLETSAFRLLWVLADGTPRTMRELADALGLEQSTVHRQVHAALDAGWLERPSAGGAAGRALRPTPAGRSAYDHDLVLRARVYAEALAVLGPERSRRLVDDLAAYNDAWDSVTASG